MFFPIHCTLVILYVTGRFLYMDSSGSVRVFRHFLDAAMSPGSFCHCFQETLRRSAASYHGIEKKKTCGLVIMHMSV